MALKYCGRLLRSFCPLVSPEQSIVLHINLSLHTHNHNQHPFNDRVTDAHDRSSAGSFCAYSNQSRSFRSSSILQKSIEVEIQSMGESISEGTIAEILKAEGDAVEEDETIAQIETDKVTVDVRAPAAGKLTELRVSTGLEIAFSDVWSEEKWFRASLIPRLKALLSTDVCRGHSQGWPGRGHCFRGERRYGNGYTMVTASLSLVRDGQHLSIAKYVTARAPARQLSAGGREKSSSTEPSQKQAHEKHTGAQDSEAEAKDKEGPSDEPPGRKPSIQFPQRMVNGKRVSDLPESERPG